MVIHLKQLYYGIAKKGNAGKAVDIEGPEPAGKICTHSSNAITSCKIPLMYKHVHAAYHMRPNLTAPFAFIVAACFCTGPGANLLHHNPVAYRDH